MITKYTIFIKESKSLDYEIIPFHEENDFFLDNEDIDYYALSDDAYELANKSIGILRNKEISLIALDSNRNLIGASFNNMDSLYPGEDFSFDIVVDENHQNKGLGIELIKKEIENYNFLEGFEDLKISLEVVNEKMKNILIKYFNFEVVETIKDGYWIMEMKQ